MKTLRVSSLLIAFAASCFFVGVWPWFADKVTERWALIICLMGVAVYLVACAMNFTISVWPSKWGTATRNDKLSWISVVFAVLGASAYGIGMARALREIVDKNDHARPVWTPDAFGAGFFFICCLLGLITVWHNDRSNAVQDRLLWAWWLYFIGTWFFILAAAFDYFDVTKDGSRFAYGDAYATMAGAGLFVAGALCAHFAASRALGTPAPAPATS